MNKSQLFLIAILIGVSSALYKQKIEAFSFDTSYGEYPMAYHQFGASVGLKSKLKLIPASTPTQGAIFLNQPIGTTEFQAIFDIEINNKVEAKDTKEVQGLGIWYLHYKPRFPENFGSILGYQSDFNGLGVFLYKEQEQWKIVSYINNGVKDISFDDVSKSYNKSNGCIIKDFNGGKLEISYKVLQSGLDVSYMIQNAGPFPGQFIRCIKEQSFKELDYQGFFGLTSSNSQLKQNDIDLQMIEFYNLNSQYYQDLENIEKRDFFAIDPIEQHKRRSSELGQTAHDLLSIKRLAEEEEKQEIKQDLSNVNEKDNFDEVVFKIFQQLRAYNNRLDDFRKGQKELQEDLRDLEENVQKESQYQNLQLELQFAESTLQEVQAKLQNLNSDLIRVVEQLQEVIYVKNQGKQGLVEYFMPPIILDKMNQVQKTITQLDASFQAYQRAKVSAGNKLQTFLKDLITFEQQKSTGVDMDSFSLVVSKKFDSRMDQYQMKVQKNAYWKNITQTILSCLACFSVFLVWSKVRSMKKKFLI